MTVNPSNSNHHSNRRRGKGFKSFDDLIPVYDRPKLFEVLLLAPDAVIEQPTVFMYADAKQGIDILPKSGEVARILWAVRKERRGGRVIEGACTCLVVLAGQHTRVERPCRRRRI